MSAILDQMLGHSQRFNGVNRVTPDHSGKETTTQGFGHNNKGANVRNSATLHPSGLRTPSNKNPKGHESRSATKAEYKPFKARPVPKTNYIPSPPPKDKPYSPASKIKMSTPPRLCTASRSQNRIAKASGFHLHAEQMKREKERQQEAIRRKTRDAEAAKSTRGSLVLLTPAKPFSISGNQWLDSVHQKWQQKRSEEEEERQRMADSFRAREYKPKQSVSVFSGSGSGKRRVTIADPFDLRSPVRHSVYQAKFEQKTKADKEKELADQSRRHSYHSVGKVPKTTYQPKPISKLESESMRRIDKIRQQRIQERKEQEEAEKNEFEFRPRPVPPTTYTPHHIAAEKEEKALRESVKVRQHKLEELEKMEHDILESREPKGFHARKAPSTTHEPPPPKSSARFEESLRTLNQRRNQKIEEIRQKNGAPPAESPHRQHKARPVPATTYSPKRVVVSRTTREMKSPHRPKSQPAAKTPEHNTKTNPEYTFHARPVPKTTYKPHPVKESDVSTIHDVESQASSAKKQKSARKSTGGGEGEFHFHARPVPVTTYKPSTPPKPVHTKTSPSTKKSTERPAKPTAVTPKKKPTRVAMSRSAAPKKSVEKDGATGSGVSSPSKTSSMTPAKRKPTSFRPIPASTRSSSNNQPTGKSPGFRARPVPRSTYQAKSRPKNVTPSHERARNSHSRSSSTSSVNTQETPRKVVNIPPLPEEDEEQQNCELAAILSDNEAPEITFTKDEGEDPELSALLDGVDPWSAAAVTDDDGATEDEHENALNALLIG